MYEKPIKCNVIIDCYFICMVVCCNTEKIIDFLHCNVKVNIEFGPSFSIAPCKKPDLNLIYKWFSNCVAYEEKIIKKKGSAWASRVIPRIDINFQSSCIIILASLKKWHIHLKRKMSLIFLISSSLVNTHGAELQQRHSSCYNSRKKAV